MHRLIALLFTIYWGMLIALLASNPPAADVPPRCCWTCDCGCNEGGVCLCCAGIAPDRPGADKKPTPPDKLNLSGDWKSSQGYLYSVTHEGITVELGHTGNWSATGALDGQTLNIVWCFSPGPGADWRYIGRYQLIDGKLVGVYGNSNCLYWDAMGHPHGEYTRDTLTRVQPK